MAVLMEMEIETTPEQYDKIEGALDVRGNPPDGFIAHTAQDVGGGKMRIVDVWESPGQALYALYSSVNCGSGASGASSPSV